MADRSDTRIRNWRVLPTLTVAEVVAVSGLSRRRVRLMIAKGELERVPETRLVRTESLMRRLGVVMLEGAAESERAKDGVSAAIQRDVAAFLRRSVARSR